jgi:hypothetical protein
MQDRLSIKVSYQYQLDYTLTVYKPQTLYNHQVGKLAGFKAQELLQLQ